MTYLCFPFRDNVLMTGIFSSFEPVVEFESARGLQPYEDGKVYQIEIERKVGRKLSVLVSISPNYPIDAPKMALSQGSLTAATSSHLQYLEEYVRSCEKFGTFFQCILSTDFLRKGDE